MSRSTAAIPEDDREEDVLLASLRAEFSERLKRDLAEVDHELAAICAGASGSGYRRIEELMHRDAGAGAVFGFDEASVLARNVETLVQELGSNFGPEALARIGNALQPLRRVADQSA